MTETVLCINAGSSSIKFQLFEASHGEDLDLDFKGQLEGIGVKPRLRVQDAAGQMLVEQTFDSKEVLDAGTAMPKLVAWLRAQLAGALPAVVGHRIVFGGTRYAAPVQIDDRVLEHLHALVPIMPLHLPPELTPIEAIRDKLPDLPQVAVFDTGFHRGHDEVIERLALPEELHREGVRRYGYHGISYEYIAGRLPEIAPDIAKGRVVVAHLGSGCSMCALVAGRSVEATMGFSGLDGLPMGTRPGRLDPGALLYLFQVKGMGAKEVERLLYRECGLKGLSGISNDVRELLTSNDSRAKMALDYFALHSARAVAELATVMGGIDGLVFTAGVGEHAAPVRAAIGAKLAWLGLEIDERANAGHGRCISTGQSRVACYVVPTNEELMIARHSLATVRAHAA
jgi:acetate kinase